MGNGETLEIHHQQWTEGTRPTEEDLQITAAD